MGGGWGWCGGMGQGGGGAMAIMGRIPENPRTTHTFTRDTNSKLHFRSSPKWDSISLFIEMSSLQAPLCMKRLWYETNKHFTIFPVSSFSALSLYISGIARGTRNVFSFFSLVFVLFMNRNRAEKRVFFFFFFFFFSFFCPLGFNSISKLFRKNLIFKCLFFPVRQAFFLLCLLFSFLFALDLWD